MVLLGRKDLKESVVYSLLELPKIVLIMKTIMLRKEQTAEWSRDGGGGG